MDSGTGSENYSLIMDYFVLGSAIWHRFRELLSKHGLFCFRQCNLAAVQRVNYSPTMDYVTGSESYSPTMDSGSGSER